ncbi:MAG TPA: hypothetical protein VFV28_08580 [Limnobacter sp.]|nr:hypothetical protein [Limnobacter sp.]
MSLVQHSPHQEFPGYFNSPWPCEDAGPRRMQATAGFEWPENAKLRLTTRRTQLSTMLLLGEPGEVFLLHHSAFRSKLGFATTSCVERIDPITLKTIFKSPRLPGGPMWPGGFAIHASGDIIVVYGNHAHRLNRQCELKASFKLPEADPYNSFIVLDNGLVVTKNLSRTNKARLSILHPLTLQPVAPVLVCPEPSIARLSAVGNTVYVAGMNHVYRATWNEAEGELQFDRGWQPDYMQGCSNTHGWDMVLTGSHAWLMDNGHHRYLYSMKRAGVANTANRLIRVSLNDPDQVNAWPVCGLKGGSVTNPPLVSPKHNIVLAYDSANSVLQAFKIQSDDSLAPLWNKAPFGCASHMVLMNNPDVVWINDYRRFTEEVVALNIHTGDELGRVKTPGHMQGVVFPCIGWNRDIYWPSMDRLSRIQVEGS